MTAQADLDLQANIFSLLGETGGATDAEGASLLGVPRRTYARYRDRLAKQGLALAAGHREHAQVWTAFA